MTTFRNPSFFTTNTGRVLGGFEVRYDRNAINTQTPPPQPVAPVITLADELRINPDILQRRFAGDFDGDMLNLVNELNTVASPSLNFNQTQARGSRSGWRARSDQHTITVTRSHVNVFTGRAHPSSKPTHIFRTYNQVKRKNQDYEAGIRDLITKDSPITGRVFTYSLNKETKVGTCCVYGIEIAQISLETGLVLKISIPAEEAVPTIPFPKVLNVTRLFLRRLGYSARRYKNFTVVETEHCVEVLSPGDTWKVPTHGTPINFKPDNSYENFLGNLQEQKVWTQRDLIPAELYRECELIHAEQKRAKEQRYNPWGSTEVFPTGTAGYFSTASGSSIPSRAFFGTSTGRTTATTATTASTLESYRGDIFTSEPRRNDPWFNRFRNSRF